MFYIFTHKKLIILNYASRIIKFLFETLIIFDLNEVHS